jgi:hypothetical protein
VPSPSCWAPLLPTAGMLGEAAAGTVAPLPLLRRRVDPLLRYASKVEVGTLAFGGVATAGACAPPADCVASPFLGLAWTSWCVVSESVIIVSRGVTRMVRIMDQERERVAGEGEERWLALTPVVARRAWDPLIAPTCMHACMQARKVPDLSAVIDAGKRP